ncbi:carboxypeptidase M32 [Rhodobacteraceae bacterium 2CG4]|uniref:Metal-dependent carboxypeptidase n=1 Tax=Halovulum marinum TaxID=2662447 RepID=A0A6L5YWF8_9RHOB|nr:carboxypeptidase M32 [Halovulum marinum]MSU88269.1 carboxypeptidase M32 [Halovulum marinum]
MTAPYDALIAHTRETVALMQADEMLGWDQETMMPPRGAAMRAEQAAALATAIHARATDPRVGDWLERIDAAALPGPAQRNVALVRRSYRRATRLPQGLGAALARATAAGVAAWAAARKAQDAALLAPALTAIVALKRDEAQALAEPGQAPYDALLDDYEPGMSAATLLPMLEALRAPLSGLRAAIAARPAPPRLTGHYPAAAQLALARQVAQVFGYALDAGRIDLAAHPFCAGQGGDVRITTRVDEADPLNCLLSTIHETGHAVYNQTMPEDTLYEPIGTHASMGVHESQSRMMENQIARSRTFAEFLQPLLARHFPDAAPADPQALHAAMNRVETGFIRTEADEVHYNLHVILRTRLESALIDGSLAVADLEEAWNSAFHADFGVAVPTPAQGVLQDIHWPKGLFGYFPTYALGNIYAAELFAALRADLPDLDARLARGEMSGVLDWLAARIHRPANTLPPAELIARAVGHAPTAAPLVAYLREKFGALYGLDAAQ